MRELKICLTRLVLSVLFAFLATRMFFGRVAYVKILILAVILFALAYLFEHLRKGEKGGDHGT